MVVEHTGISALKSRRFHRPPANKSSGNKLTGNNISIFAVDSDHWELFEHIKCSSYVRLDLFLGQIQINGGMYAFSNSWPIKCLRVITRMRGH